jgi:N-dimethylarginine dimethylaminohydrolase
MELDGLASTLASHGVDVLRPADVAGLEQVFARDVGLVVEDVFFRSRMIEDRQGEWGGILPLLGDLTFETFPEGVRVEGGDVLLLDGAIVVGVTRSRGLMGKQTARTNADAADFLRERFPHRDVLECELHKDDRDPLKNALHLDCAYMPLGGGEAIIAPEAFLQHRQLDALKSRHSSIIEISRDEAALLQSNLLHLDPHTLLIDPRFNRLGRTLESFGYSLISCPMESVGRMGGLFRCTTLPLNRLS